MASERYLAGSLRSQVAPVEEELSLGIDELGTKTGTTNILIQLNKIVVKEISRLRVEELGTDVDLDITEKTILRRQLFIC